MRSVLAALAVLALAGCNNMTSPNQGGQSVDLTGKWVGDFMVLGQDGSITWQLTQNGAMVSGPVTVALLNGVVAVNGTLSGTYAASTLTYTIDVPAGGIPSQPNCVGQISGTATVTVAAATTMTGPYSVTSNNCAQPFPGGTVTLTKQ